MDMLRRLINCRIIIIIIIILHEINVAHESATRCSKIQVIQELFGPSLLTLSANKQVSKKIACDKFFNRD